MTITLHCLDCGFGFRSRWRRTPCRTTSQNRSRAASVDAGAGQPPDWPPSRPLGRRRCDAIRGIQQRTHRADQRHGANGFWMNV